MLSLYTHLSWFVFIACLLMRRLLLSFYISCINQSLYLSFPLFNLLNIDSSVSFYFDFISSWFFTVISLISTIIIVYSFFYIAPYSKSIYFLWTTVLFVISILIVVRISNLFYLMLGWDGLGLVSFFLIVFYQNQSSITSGLFTLIINRIGDCFFLITIVLFFYTSFDLTCSHYHIPRLLAITILLITFITKRAIFPFSPWLPLAIAAPTPISALVHSSTLVTAGLFLIMRFSYILYSSFFICKFLLIVRVYTSFYAGINTLYEKDLKKLIALSTLSHLGFIGIAFSVGLTYLAFFHLLTHALFKSLLFITIGDIIINLNHSQDIRYLSTGILVTPFSCLIIYVSLINLLGIPNVRGYFSKDLVLEIINYSRSSSILTAIVFCNVAFTYYYTYQLFFYSFQSSKINPYQLFHSPITLHSSLLLILSIFSVIFGFFFISTIYSFILFTPVPSFIKFLPVLLNLRFFISLTMFLGFFISKSKFLNSYFSQIIFLSTFIMRVASNCHITLSHYLVKTRELGLYNNIFNVFPSHIFSLISRLNYIGIIKNPIKIITFCFLLTLFMV